MTDLVYLCKLENGTEIPGQKGIISSSLLLLSGPIKVGFKNGQVADLSAFTVNSGHCKN